MDPAGGVVPITLAVVQDVFIEASWFPAAAGQPVQPLLNLVDELGSPLNAALTGTPGVPTGALGDGVPIYPLSGLQTVDVHGVVAQVGDPGPVRLDLSAYVTVSNLLHTSVCQFYGVVTPIS
jgi:hypothetical protein